MWRSVRLFAPFGEIEPATMFRLVLGNGRGDVSLVSGVFAAAAAGTAAVVSRGRLI